MSGLKQIHEEDKYFIVSRSKNIKLPKAVREISGIEKFKSPPHMEYFIPNEYEKRKYPDRHLIIILSKPIKKPIPPQASL